MPIKYLRNLSENSLRGKKVLVRVDFNVKSAIDSLRLERTVPTIKFLLKNGATPVLISHRGRPKPGARIVGRDETLRVAVPFLTKALRRKIYFFPSLNLEILKEKINNAPRESVILLENLRLLPGEEADDPILGRKLASLAHIYVNDAFAVNHRKNASVTQIPKHLKSYAGLLLEDELRELGNLSKSPKRPFVIILGGAKASDKIGIIERFLPYATHILLGGVPANTFLKARGFDIDKSPYEPSMLERAKKLLQSEKIILPKDFVSFQGKILDIGKESAELFKHYIKGARTILWNGPLGLFEDPRFAKGSETIARAIASGRGYSIVGGGETTALILKLNLEKWVSFLSTGGGAMLEYIADKKLPGIEALK